jgi:hypothetical protein
MQCGTATGTAESNDSCRSLLLSDRWSFSLVLLHSLVVTSLSKLWPLFSLRRRTCA